MIEIECGAADLIINREQAQAAIQVWNKLCGLFCYRLYKTVVFLMVSDIDDSLRIKTSSLELFPCFCFQY